LAVSKQAAQEFDVEIFNNRQLSELEVRKQHNIKAKNRFLVLENLNNSEHLNRSSEIVKENIKILIMLGRQKYIHYSHECLNRVPLRLKWLFRR
jgi:hypothetical protein